MSENEKESSSSQNCVSHSVGKRGLTYLHFFWIAYQREKFLSDRQKRKRELVALKKHIVEQVDAHHSKKKTVEEKRLSSLLKRAGSYQEQINEFSKTLSEEVRLLKVDHASAVSPCWRIRTLIFVFCPDSIVRKLRRCLGTAMNCKVDADTKRGQICLFENSGLMENQYGLFIAYIDCR
jgi:hypothetical protein